MERFVTPALKNSEEMEYERDLRPLSFSEYIGQSKVKENLEIYVKVAIMRQEALDHVLLFGPPGSVSYTHLDVYKRQASSNSASAA